MGRPVKFESDDLLDRAVDLIWCEGPLTLSLNEIAARLDIAKPALARRFGGKDAFLAAVLKRYHARLDGPVRKAIAETDSVEEIARGYLGSYLAVLSEKPVGPTTGCLLAAATEACAAQGDSLLAETTRLLNAQTRVALVDALRRAGAAEPNALARYLYGQSVALAFLSRCGAGADALSDFLERALAGVQTSG